MTRYLDAFSLMSPSWVIEDVLVYALAAALFFFALKQRAGQAPYLFLGMIGFIFLSASVYENFAVTLGHYYSYGPSLIMIGNAPLAVPVIEALVFIGCLIILAAMGVPAWTYPFLVGF